MTLLPDFWDDPAKAKTITLKINALKRKFQPWEKLRQQLSDCYEFYTLGKEEDDESLSAEAYELFATIQTVFNKLKLNTLLNQPEDMLASYLTIHSGAGGTEACDWAQMLYRMYLRWAERKNYKTSLVDLQEATGGIKSVTFSIQGEYVYGYLKGETGVHRLVRISPFDSNARRHTSFCSVYASPIIDDTVELDIKPEEVRIDTYRSSGAGGQHVNTTDSAVRITHIETNIVVQCQNERSQIKNRETAWKMLRSRLFEYYKEKQKAEQEQKAMPKMDIAWGSQIRSYTFQPYTLIKDTRTAVEATQIQAVMDGDIDPFIEGFLTYNAK